MPAYNGNRGYLRINGWFVVNAFAKSFRVNNPRNPVETTAGFGKDWKDKGEGLQESAGTLLIAYDDIAAANNFRAMFSKGPLRVEFSPEALDGLPIPGKPFHDQAFVIANANGPEVHVNKNAVELEYALESDGEPDFNMYEGDTVP